MQTPTSTPIDLLNTTYDLILTGVLTNGPIILTAILLVILGWLFGIAVSKLIQQIISVIKLDKALKAAGTEDFVEKIGFKLNSGKFIGEIGKWFVIIVFAITALNMLNLTEATNFLSVVAQNFIPRLLSAIIIMVIAVLVSEALRKFIIASAKSANISSANFLGSLVKWAIWIFAGLAAVAQLIPDPTFFNTLFQGITVALALAFGLSFGLGGKEAAADFIEKTRKEMSDHD